MVRVSVHNTRWLHTVAAKHFHHRSWSCIDSQVPGKTRKLCDYLSLKLRNLRLFIVC